MDKKEYQVHVKQSKRYFYSITTLKSFVRRWWNLCILVTAYCIEIPSLLQSFEAGGVLDACLLRRLRLPGFNGYITCDLSFHPILHYSVIDIPVIRHGKTIDFVRSFLHFFVLAGILKQDTVRSIHISLCHMERVDISKGGTLIIVLCQDI